MASSELLCPHALARLTTRRGLRVFGVWTQVPLDEHQQITRRQPDPRALPTSSAARALSRYLCWPPLGRPKMVAEFSPQPVASAWRTLGSPVRWRPPWSALTSLRWRRLVTRGADARELPLREGGPERPSSAGLRPAREVYVNDAFVAAHRAQREHPGIAHLTSEPWPPPARREVSVLQGILPIRSAARRGYGLAKVTDSRVIDAIPRAPTDPRRLRDVLPLFAAQVPRSGLALRGSGAALPVTPRGADTRLNLTSVHHHRPGFSATPSEPRRDGIDVRRG